MSSERFQYSHYGDHTKPENWFVDAETALQYGSTLTSEEDGLGYYADGTKRTLTDEQVAMFRHSEIEHLLRERRLVRDEEEYQNREPEGGVEEAPRSPISDISSLEGDLVGLAAPAPPKPAYNGSAKHRTAKKQRSKAQPQRQPSQSSRSDTSWSTDPARRARREEVPYGQRHKRKWENFVDEIDSVEGSLTHRRIVRQLDEDTETALEIDYGEEMVLPSKTAAMLTAPKGRRVVSYEDD
ncbi:hypothetical protein LTR91_000513 [Friedmanniomyces endolithicus]|uniref:Uncharacterized protein n=1 Tax=Friedmanniomyces endolithicus TaxID=329885 RepID=A0AAN6L3X3_9PEZI|nr:hypothetical protein LTS09_005235 [Friedmanniomyces endolithicus]KAK0267434.1 hypothetical protein LTR35_016276 [Friedmanniomyces endolithicus]KAK0286007.1 hypothetical protein LTS00_010539 [Friedmanniomyces endolithicus]KAK0309332.1 hypothetical protein LTR01_004439 [Friedmanniomyces endolithicus]KAK0321143.1 hypothetical protein LTR82_008060 [Friedmanniomyces endolithicus]